MIWPWVSRTKPRSSSGSMPSPESQELYGPVASVPTAWRCVDELAHAGHAGRRRIVRAVSKARAHVWDLIVDRHGVLPPIRVADKQVRGMVGIGLDATLVTAPERAARQGVED